MEIHENLRSTLERIHFIDRYRALSEQYSCELNQSFENYSNENVLKIIALFGYSVKYIKSGNFFKIVELYDKYKFQFHLSLKYGVVELIWSISENEGIHQLGGPWGMIKRLLDEKEDDKVKLPVFRNYEDLKEILREVFCMYEDFKKTLIGAKKAD